ncbi:putative Cu-dependent DNA-binding protein [Aspergillus affinis]|uniref:putative Cu-dependent DNA-binding protein n=1 Tax=Aspergillus affinis TaxID=1070780 RepID=UPI0022FE23AA|nr:copper-fist-domain-containing protein [Aspergillus affinis]KAI9037806.1 copper-fist-domain-containing protein [Aspergillus affinis]
MMAFFVSFFPDPQISRVPGRRPSSTRAPAAFIPIAPRPAPSSVSSVSSASSSLVPESGALPGQRSNSVPGLKLEDLQYSQQVDPALRDVPMTTAMGGGGASLAPSDSYVPLSCASLASSPLGSLAETPLSVSMSMSMSMSMPMSMASGAWATDATPAYGDVSPFTLEDMDVDVIGDWTWLSQTV